MKWQSVFDEMEKGAQPEDEFPIGPKPVPLEEGSPTQIIKPPEGLAAEQAIPKATPTPPPIAAAPQALAQAASAAAPIEAAAGPVGLGVAAGQLAVAGAETLINASQSQSGSIAGYLPASGGGGGTDYAGQAFQRSILAALNKAGGLATRMGG